MKIGILGAALSHPAAFARAIRELRIAEVSGIWSSEEDQGRRDRFAAELGLEIFPSAEETIDRSDALMVTTTTNEHLPFALLALSRHKPVFVDKPLATNLADASAIVEAARLNDAALMSCSVRRYTPPFVSIAEQVRSGGAGRPIQAVRFEPHGVSPGDWQDRVETSGGLIFNFGIHVVDTLQLVLGPKAAEVHAFADKLEFKEVESHDTAVLTVRFANGAVGIGQVVGAMHPNEHIATAPSLCVFCTQNSYTARLDENQAFEYTGRRLGVSPYYFLLSGVHDTMRAFVRMVETGEPAIPHDEMLEVVRILEAARTSAAERRTVVLDGS